MKERITDYKYALELLTRFNRFAESEPRLRDLFVYKGWNFLQIYQASIFDDLKVWTRERTIQSVRPKLRGILLLKVALSTCFMVAISIISSVYIIGSRKRVLVFSSDKTSGSNGNDFRLEVLYNALKSEHSSYCEILHTTGGFDMAKRFVKRGRAVMYMETIDALFAPLVWGRRRRARVLASTLDLTAFKPEERKLIKFLLDKYISAVFITRARLKGLKAFLSLSGIRAVFSIDDTRHYNELMGAAGELGIHSYALQHGHFTKYHTGWINETALPGKVMKPKFLVVWSEYWKRELVRLGSIFSAAEILVGGERARPSPAPRAKSHTLCVLIPYEKDAPKSEVSEYIREFLKEDGTVVIMKLRADEDAKAQLEEYGLADMGEKVISVQSEVGVMNRVNVVAGTYSTFLYDMVAVGKPVVVLETSLDYGEGMVTNGLATLLRRDGDVHGALMRAADTSESELAARQEKLLGSGSKKLGQTLRDIISSHA